MKNVLIHLHPSGAFDHERGILARIQVDNSLDLGWARDDIMMITNFPWEYQGIKAIEVSGREFCEVKPRSTNTVIIPHLFDLDLIKPGEIYWVHDFDACQLHSFKEQDPQLGKADVGFTTYGWSPKWNLGSFFFTSGARDVFEQLKAVVYRQKTEDERALRWLTGNGHISDDRYVELNITYNFGMRHVAHNFSMAEKPLKVLHFHPFYKEVGLRPLRSFMYGENELLVPLMDNRLMRIFQHHGIK